MSALEDRFYQQLQWAGVKLPERNYLIFPDRKNTVDFIWHDEGVIVEIEGGVYESGAKGRGRHLRPQGFIDDCRKYNRITLMGYRLLRFTANMIDDGTALQDTEHAIALWEKEGIT